jgi:hypothetical protein
LEGGYGIGEHINIWSDPWIPSSPDRRVISQRNGAVYTKVAELINPFTGQWDDGLLYSLFNVVDAQRILQIPLNNHGFDDFIVWSASKNGRYSV